MRAWSSLILFASILLLAAAPPAPLNEKVLEFARSKKGERVGNGQCTALVFEAFRQVGARCFRPFGRDADYVWGEPVESIKDVLPGDVLQFRDAVFKGRKAYPDGTYRFWMHTYPHHTAIVSRVRKTKGQLVLSILHQNIGIGDVDEEDRKVVQETTINMAELQKGGSVRAYRPVPIKSEDDGDDR